MSYCNWVQAFRAKSAAIGRRPSNNGAQCMRMLENGEKRRSLSRDDLQFESPYNTYLHTGLPPGPIGNSGRASVAAVLWPDTTRYLYFVARGDGSHIFSYDLEGHNRARYQIQREQEAERDSLKKAALGTRVETAVKSSSP